MCGGVVEGEVARGSECFFKKNPNLKKKCFSGFFLAGWGGVGLE